MEGNILKVLYLTNIPSPYRVDFFNELGKLCELTVLFERETASDRDKAWATYTNSFFQKKQLNGISISADSALSLGAITHLMKNRYDIIIVGGYSTPTAMLTILFMKVNKIPFVLNADGGLIKEEFRLIEWVKKFFISSADGFLSTGKETDKYLIHYGAEKTKIYHYPFSSVKEDIIPPSVLTKCEKDKLRKKLNIEEDKVLVSVGQFIYRKGFDVLIKAMVHLNDSVLYIIGGEPTEEYMTLLEEYAIDNVKFLPFMEQEKLFQFYRAADIFVLSTREDIWGLVINEAMSQGLPVITTNRCVAGLELVTDYENGFLVQAEDEEMLVQRIKILLENEELREKMSNVSLDVIRGYSIETMAKRHLEIMKEIISN